MLTHFFPVIIVQRIYKVDKGDYDLSKSLLAADQYRSEDIGGTSSEGDSPKGKGGSKYNSSNKGRK